MSLYENPFIELPDVLFGKIDTLRSLRLWGTSLSTIPNFIFSNLTNLEVLVLTKNTKLHSLPKDTFSGLTKLVELYLYTNNFSSLPAGLFQNLQSLQILSLYNNTFDLLPDNLLKPLTNLGHLYLNNSKITTLPGNMFKLLPNLKRVHLEDNNWMCDCKLKEFMSWLENNTEKVPNHMSLLCTNPPSLKAIPVLAVGALSCPSSTIQEQKSGSYMLSTPLSSWDNSNTDGGTTTTTTTTKIEYSVTEHTSNWNNNKTQSINHPETSTKRTSSGHKLHSKVTILHICGFPSGNLIYFLLYITTSMQVLLTIVQCFVLIKIETLYNHFNIPTEPVVSMHVLVPQTGHSPEPNK